jgi:hypothetical protein
MIHNCSSRFAIGNKDGIHFRHQSRLIDNHDRGSCQFRRTFALQTVCGGENDETLYLVLLQSADLNCLHFGIAIGDGDHDAEANIRCGMVNGLNAASHKVVGKKGHYDADDSGTVSLEPTR